MRHEAGLVSLGMSMGAASGPVHLIMTGRSHRQLLVLGPTVTRTLRAQQAERYQPYFDNTRRLRELVEELETLAVEVITQAEGWNTAVSGRT